MSTSRTDPYTVCAACRKAMRRSKLPTHTCVPVTPASARLSSDQRSNTPLSETGGGRSATSLSSTPRQTQLQPSPGESRARVTVQNTRSNTTRAVPSSPTAQSPPRPGSPTELIVQSEARRSVSSSVTQQSVRNSSSEPPARAPGPSERGRSTSLRSIEPQPPRIRISLSEDAPSDCVYERRSSTSSLGRRSPPPTADGLHLYGLDDAVAEDEEPQVARSTSRSGTSDEDERASGLRTRNVSKPAAPSLPQLRGSLPSSVDSSPPSGTLAEGDSEPTESRHKSRSTLREGDTAESEFYEESPRRLREPLQRSPSARSERSPSARPVPDGSRRYGSLPASASPPDPAEEPADSEYPPTGNKTKRASTQRPRSVHSTTSSRTSSASHSRTSVPRERDGVHKDAPQKAVAPSLPAESQNESSASKGHQAYKRLMAQLGEFTPADVMPAAVAQPARTSRVASEPSCDSTPPTPPAVAAAAVVVPQHVLDQLELLQREVEELRHEQQRHAREQESSARRHEEGTVEELSVMRHTLSAVLSRVEALEESNTALRETVDTLTEYNEAMASAHQELLRSVRDQHESLRQLLTSSLGKIDPIWDALETKGGEWEAQLETLRADLTGVQLHVKELLERPAPPPKVATPERVGRGESPVQHSLPELSHSTNTNTLTSTRFVEVNQAPVDREENRLPAASRNASSAILFSCAQPPPPPVAPPKTNTPGVAAGASLFSDIALIHSPDPRRPAHSVAHFTDIPPQRAPPPASQLLRGSSAPRAPADTAAAELRTPNRHWQAGRPTGGSLVGAAAIFERLQGPPSVVVTHSRWHGRLSRGNSPNTPR